MKAKKLTTLGILLVTITWANAWNFGHDFNFKIPFLKDGPSLGFEINAKGNRGNTDEMRSAIRKSMSNLRASVNDFTGNILLESTAAIRNVFNVSDKAFKDILSKIPGIDQVFNGKGKSDGKGFSLPKLPGLPNLKEILGKFNTTRMKELLGLPDLSALESKDLSNSSVESAMDSLQKSTDNAITDAKKKIEGIYNNFKEHAKDMLNEANSIVISTRTQLNQTIHKLDSDIRNCVEEYGNPIEDGLDAAQENAEKCLNNKINEAKYIVDKTLIDVNSARMGINYLRGNLSNCQLNISISLGSIPLIDASQAACFASALLNIQSEILTLPVGIAARATETVSLFTTSKGYLMNCVAHLMEDVSKQTTNTTLAVAKCTAEKQNSE